MHEVTSPKELHDIWPLIRDGLTCIGARCKGIVEMPEDAYFAIKNGTDKLLIATIDGQYQGFVTTRMVNHPDGVCIHIQSCHNAGVDPDFVENCYELIDHIATLIGAIRISACSSRKGWEKAAKRLGYANVATIT